jgi:hypothetical protein
MDAVLSGFFGIVAGQPQDVKPGPRTPLRFDGEAMLGFGLQITAKKLYP